MKRLFGGREGKSNVDDVVSHTVASTAGRVASCGAVLLHLHCATRIEDTCGVVLEKGNHPKLATPQMILSN